MFFCRKIATTLLLSEGGQSTVATCKDFQIRLFLFELCGFFAKLVKVMRQIPPILLALVFVFVILESSCSLV